MQARADADIGKVHHYRTTPAYGFEPEGKFDASSVTILGESRKDHDWTIYSSSRQERRV